jgi:AraC family transcriptional regulator, arabinose operon regulatory protein
MSRDAWTIRRSLGQDRAVTIAEGFRDERLAVVPRPLVAEALRAPVTRRLLATDAGWFPRARAHGIRRPSGVAETVVILCTAGAGWVETTGPAQRVGAGDAVVLPASVPHAYGADADDPWTIWWCHLAGTDVADLVGALAATPERPIVAVRRPDQAVALLDEIVGGLERDPSPAERIAASGAAWRLLTRIAADRMLPGHGDPLQRAIAHLAERLDRPVPVAELARLVGVSPSHLGALFRRATGGGVLAHHTALRMARARRLLDGTDTPVARIAREVGYEDAFYFSRRFARHHGMSPTAYRRRDAG